MINFIKISKITLLASIFFSLLSLCCIIKYEFNLGIEFTGGLEIEIESHNIISINDLRKNLNDFENIKIKYYGSKKIVQLKIKNTNNDIKNTLDIIKTKISENMMITKYDFIGEEINKENIKNTLIAIFIASISIFIYLTFRFKYKMAISAIITLFHDIIIILGIISFFSIELNLIILSSLFTIFGYSINDTVIIFDRIREIENKIKKNYDIKEIINLSINKTLSRTIITSLSTLIVTIILSILSDEYLFNFYLILSLGIIIGTYSSIYISANLLLIINKKK